MGAVAKDAGRTGIYGRSGSGKSTRAKELVAGLRRIVVFDALREYRQRGFTELTTLRGLRDHLARNWPTGFRCAYVPPSGHEAEALHVVSTLLKRAQQPYFRGKDPRQLTFLVEELNMSFPVTALPAKLNGFPELCSRGRHYGIALIGVSQRLAEINTRFRGNTTESYYFRLADHADLTTAARVIGPAWKGKLATLQDHQYLHVCGGDIGTGWNEFAAANDNRAAPANDNKIAKQKKGQSA